MEDENKGKGIFDSLPAFLNTKDLVDLGIYRNIDAAYLARLNGNSPNFIQVDRKVLYKKEDVIAFIEKHTHKGDEKKLVDPLHHMSKARMKEVRDDK